MPRPVRLTYFRHGETAWSLSGQHTGASEIPLTPHGEEQARALRPRVEATGFWRVLSSPRLRARETCRLAGASADPEIEPDAAEWNYGDYEGLRTVEIRAERPGWNIFRDGCPNGESPADIQARADRVIARIRTLEGEVALFSHGHFGLVFAARWIGLDVAQARHFKLDPASASLLRFDSAEPDAADIALWNASTAAIGAHAARAP